MNEGPTSDLRRRQLRIRRAIAAGAIALLSLLAVVLAVVRSPDASGPADEPVAAAAAAAADHPAPSAVPASPASGGPATALPSAPAVLQPASTSTASTARSSWPLVLGAALCFGALLLGALGLTWDRTPRARGMSRARRSGSLAGMALRAEAVTDTVLQRGGKGSIIGDALEHAGLDLRPGEFMVTVCVAALVAGVIAWAAVALLFGVVVAVLVLVLSKVVVSLLGGRRRKQFVDQLAETLQLLTGSLRAGNGLTQALDTVARESEAPTSNEFRRVLVEVRLGRDLSGALQALADRMRSRDLLWVVQAIDINREIGGNLAEILDTITGTIRDRGRLRRQVSALTAEGRLSALVVMILPFALAGVMAVVNPDYLAPLYTTFTGIVLLGIGGATLTVGGLWLRKLVTSVF